MERDELQKHTLSLYTGDYRKLQELFPEIGAAAVIRRIVRAYIRKLEAKSTEEIEKLEVEL